MKRIIAFSVLGATLAVAGGVGLSTAHTMGFFGPAQTDWLSTNRMSAPNPPTVIETPQAIEPTLVAAPAPQLVLPNTQDFVPEALIQAQVVLPDTPGTGGDNPNGENNEPITPVVRPEPNKPEPTPVEPVQTITTNIGAADIIRAPSIQPPQPRIAPVQTIARTPSPQRNTDLGNVWASGVFR